MCNIHGTLFCIAKPASIFFRAIARCPVCNESITVNDLAPDRALRKMVKRKRKEQTLGILGSDSCGVVQL